MAAEGENVPSDLFSYTNKQHTFGLDPKFHVSFEAAKISLNIKSLSDWLRT